MKDRYSLFRIKKDRIGKADMQGSDKKPSGKTDMQEPDKKLSDKADIPGSGKKLSDKTDIQGRGKKQSGKADVHERRESGGKLTGKSAPKSAKATRDQTGLRKLLNDRRLAVSCFALCAAALCILCISVVKTLSSRDDSVHVLPVTLAGALTENNEDEEFAEEQAGDENVRIRRKTKMLLNALVNDLQTAETFTLKEPVDPQKESSIEAAASIGYKSMQTVSENQPMSYTDYYTLLQIVEAECTGGDEKSKLLVADVILNRVEDEHFPDNVYDVVWQRLGGQAQFSPTQDGRMGTLSISDTTISAVKRAVEGEDISEGALFFLARKYSSKSSVDWFDSELVYLFSHGGHDFYRFRDASEETEAES